MDTPSFSTDPLTDLDPFLNAVRVCNLDVLLDPGSFRQKLHILFKISGNKNSIWWDNQSFSTPMTQRIQKSFLRWLGIILAMTQSQLGTSSCVDSACLEWKPRENSPLVVSTRKWFPLRRSQRGDHSKAQWVNINTHNISREVESTPRGNTLKTWISMKYYSASTQSQKK